MNNLNYAQKVQLMNDLLAKHEQSKFMGKRECKAHLKACVKSVESFCDTSGVMGAKTADSAQNELFWLIGAWCQKNAHILEHIKNYACFKEIKLKV